VSKYAEQGKMCSECGHPTGDHHTKCKSCRATVRVCVACGVRFKGTLRRCQALGCRRSGERVKDARRRRSVWESDEEFFARRTEPGPNGCIHWIGSRDQSGYGALGSGNGSAHRWAYTVFKGPIPAGQTIHHKCANRLCVNPDHLEQATHRENVGEMFARKAYEARITELETQLEEAHQRIKELEQ
jgi:HNH endonuclease